MRKIGFLLLLAATLSGCALFKRARVHENNAIEGKEFNLPVFLYPAKDTQAKKLLIFLSGDGGWIKFEDELSLKFAENGFYTIGINSRDYFWEQKTPEQTERDVVQLIRKYAFKYKTRQIYICGYSFGADVVPFIYSRLPYRAKRHVKAIEMLSPYATSAFKVRFGDLTRLSGDNYPYKVDLEIKKINIPIFCFYGEEEVGKPLKNINQKNVVIDSIPGSHHYQTAAYNKIVAVLK